MECQLEAVNIVAAPLQSVPMGASHAIRHQLGPLRVGHGETRFILMPAVARWKARVHATQQKVLDIFWNERDVRSVLEGKGLREKSGDLAKAFYAIF